MTKYLVMLCLIMSLTLILAGCGHAPKRRSHFDPYTVNGKTYYPLKSAVGYREDGLASWYGPSFHGKRTASGEKYNQKALTCAHKTLPFGTKVLVTNLKNNRSAILKVNDRGPFSDKRLIDISKAAAIDIGIIGPGTGKVRVVALTDEKPKPTDKKPNPTEINERALERIVDYDDLKEYFIQVGAFSQKANAAKVALQLMQMGNQSRIFFGHNGLWNVQAGPLDDPQIEATLDYFQETFPQAYVVAP